MPEPSHTELTRERISATHCTKKMDPILASQRFEAGSRSRDTATTVNSRKLEHLCGMIYAAFPCYFGLGLEDSHVTTFWTLPYTLPLHVRILKGYTMCAACELSRSTSVDAPFTLTTVSSVSSTKGKGV